MQRIRFTRAWHARAALLTAAGALRWLLRGNLRYARECGRDAVWFASYAVGLTHYQDGRQ